MKMNKQYLKARQKGLSNIDLLKMKETARIEANKMLEKASKRAFLSMLAIPLNVLINDYWSKTGKSKAPKFIEDVLSLYDSYEKGFVTDKELADFLKEYAGIEIKIED